MLSTERKLLTVRCLHCNKHYSFFETAPDDSCPECGYHKYVVIEAAESIAK